MTKMDCLCGATFPFMQRRATVLTESLHRSGKVCPMQMSWRSQYGGVETPLQQHLPPLCHQAEATAHGCPPAMPMLFLQWILFLLQKLPEISAISIGIQLWGIAPSGVQLQQP